MLALYFGCRYYVSDKKCGWFDMHIGRGSKFQEWSMNSKDVIKMGPTH